MKTTVVYSAVAAAMLVSTPAWASLNGFFVSGSKAVAPVCAEFTASGNSLTIDLGTETATCTQSQLVNFSNGVAQPPAPISKYWCVVGTTGELAELSVKGANITVSRNVEIIGGGIYQGSVESPAVTFKADKKGECTVAGAAPVKPAKPSKGGGSSGGGSSGGGSSGPNVVSASNRDIDTSKATGALLLSSPDQALKAGVAVIQSAFSSGEAKSSSSTQTAAVQNCSGGGTKDTTASASGFSSIYNSCKEGGILQDGVTSGTFSGFNVSLSFGNSSKPYLVEVLSGEKYRTLFSGTMDVATQLDSSFQPTSSSADIILKGAVINLSKSGTPRADFENGAAGDPFGVDIVFGDEVSTITYAGPFKVASPCGSGTGRVSTPTPLKVQDNGDITSGVMQVTSGGSSATYSYSLANNGEQLIKVTAGGQTKTYTEDQVEASCNL